MAAHTAALSSSYIHSCKPKPSHPAVFSPNNLSDRTPAYNSLVFQVFIFPLFSCSNSNVLFSGGFGLICYLAVLHCVAFSVSDEGLYFVENVL